MKAYGEEFTEFYRLELSDYPLTVAPWIYNCCLKAGNTRESPRLLDLCCGTGQLAKFFLERGFHVTGIDSSASMLREARKLCKDYLNCGKARFIEGDAVCFNLSGPFDLITATSDSMNHLGGVQSFRRCLQSIAGAAAPRAMLIFDIITEKGLRRWESSFVSADPLMIMTGHFNEREGAAVRRMISYLKPEEGESFRRFETELKYYALKTRDISEALVESGFEIASFYPVGPFEEIADNPEELRRVFAVCRRKQEFRIS